jgi:hypothetical protein
MELFTVKMAQVHYSGNKTWQGVPGIHKLCGAHEQVPVLVVRTDEELALLPEATENCAAGVADTLLYVELPAQAALHELHNLVIDTVPWEGSKLLFTEEWLATYMVCPVACSMLKFPKDVTS